jgi:hypothetical protein
VEDGEGSNVEVTAKGLQDPNKLRHLKERRWRKLVNLHRKGNFATKTFSGNFVAVQV